MINSKVKMVLDERRIKAEVTAKNNRFCAEKIDGFKQAYADFQGCIIEKGRCLALGEKFDEKNYEKIRKNLEKLLKQANLTIEDLTPNYTCKKCQDCGTFGGYICDCAIQIEKEINNKQTSVTRKLHTFNDCDYSIFENDTIPNYYKSMQKWAQNPVKPFLTITGTVGSGKTFLLDCLASEFIAQNKSVIYKTAFALNQDFLKARTDFDKKNLNVIDDLLSVDVLIIDDLGTEPKYKNVTIEYLYLILNERMQNGNVTLISTNLALSEIFEMYGARCGSRIINKNNGYLINFQHPDLRLARRNKKSK